MSRYAGLLVLLLGALFAVNFTSDVLYARAIAAQADEADQAAVAAAGAPARLPLTGLIQLPTGRWGQGRTHEFSAMPAVQTAQVRTSTEQPASR